jgi:hypothetical protein
MFMSAGRIARRQLPVFSDRLAHSPSVAPEAQESKPLSGRSAEHSPGGCKKEVAHADIGAAGAATLIAPNIQAGDAALDAFLHRDRRRLCDTPWPVVRRGLYQRFARTRP